jgi:hypothetical protein
LKKIALEPIPSWRFVATPVEEPKASETKRVFRFKRRIIFFCGSEMRAKLPEEERATPLGEENDAVVPIPSAIPDDPLPANVLTDLVDRSILRINLLLVSATMA